MDNQKAISKYIFQIFRGAASWCFKPQEWIKLTRIPLRSPKIVETIPDWERIMSITPHPRHEGELSLCSTMCHDEQTFSRQNLWVLDNFADVVTKSLPTNHSIQLNGARIDLDVVISNPSHKVVIYHAHYKGVLQGNGPRQFCRLSYYPFVLFIIHIYNDVVFEY